MMAFIETLSLLKVWISAFIIKNLFLRHYIMTLCQCVVLNSIDRTSALQTLREGSLPALVNVLPGSVVCCGHSDFIGLPSPTKMAKAKFHFQFHFIGSVKKSQSIRF